MSHPMYPSEKSFPGLALVARLIQLEWTSKELKWKSWGYLVHSDMHLVKLRDPITGAVHTFWGPLRCIRGGDYVVILRTD